MVRAARTRDAPTLAVARPRGDGRRRRQLVSDDSRRVASFRWQLACGVNGSARVAVPKKKFSRRWVRRVRRDAAVTAPRLAPRNSANSRSDGAREHAPPRPATRAAAEMSGRGALAHRGLAVHVDAVDQLAHDGRLALRRRVEQRLLVDLRHRRARGEVEESWMQPARDGQSASIDELGGGAAASRSVGGGFPCQQGSQPSESRHATAARASGPATTRRIWTGSQRRRPTPCSRWSCRPARRSSTRRGRRRSRRRRPQPAPATAPPASSSSP